MDSVVHSADRDQTMASNSHLQEGKNNGKLLNNRPNKWLLLLITGGHLQEVLIFIVVILALRYSIGGCLQEVAACGGLTVSEFSNDCCLAIEKEETCFSRVQRKSFFQLAIRAS